MTAPDGVSRHDDHLADWLAQPEPAGIGDVVRFDHAKQQWHIWDGFRWAPDKTTLIIDMIRAKGMQYIEEAHDGDDRKAFLTLLDISKKQGVLKSLAARRGIAMAGDEWDPDPTLIAFTNGVLDMKTGEFNTAPSPDLLLSRSTRQPYDPAASAPWFARFLQEVMGDDVGLTNYLAHVLGYSLFGWQREQKFWMWVGQGQNGKGTLAKVMTHALGDYADSPSAELYMKTRFGAARSDAARPDLLRLQGVRFTWMSEPQGGRFAEETLKAHTGDDPIQGRDLYGKAASFTTFRPSHTIIFLTNDPPRTEDVGASMQRRAKVIKFEQDFRGTRDDKGLEDKLKLEAPGILNLLTSLAMERVNGGLYVTIPEPEQVTTWSSEYIEENDPLSAFIQDACVVSPGVSSSAALLWGAYQDWCARTNTDEMSRTGLGLALGRRFQRRKTSQTYVYLRIRPKSAMETAESGDDD